MFTGQEFRSVDSKSTKQNGNNERGLDDTSKILNNKIPHTFNNSSTIAGAGATSEATNNSPTGRALGANGVDYSTNIAGGVNPMRQYAAVAHRNSLAPQYTNMTAENASLHNQVVDASDNSNYQHTAYLRQQPQQNQQQQSPSMKTEEESQLYGDILMNSGVVPDVHQSLVTHTNLNELSSSRKTGVNNTAANAANTSALNKQLFFMNMNMNNNPHALNDPSIMETLSPFFQPFGVDVAHLPMTNPPIFQSSLPGCDEPIRRRRISISNGQISQLGEDIETLENLHNTQPPPMPNFHNYNGGNQNKDVSHKQTFNQAAPVNIPLYGSKKNTNPLDGAALGDQNSNYSKNHQQNFVKQPSKDTPTESASDLEGMTTFVPTTGSDNLSIKNMNKPSMRESRSNPSFSSRPQESHLDLGVNSHVNSHVNATPGTSAWKRARLLERNRIAASKCRQRKKVAQVQLQREFNEIKEENKILQKKLIYYEKLISKFKKFSEIHLREHEKTSKNSDNDGNNTSGSNGKNESMTLDSLKIIEELLMIDSDVTEVDKETGKIITIKHEPYSKRFRSNSDDGDDYDDDDGDMEFKLVKGRKFSENQSSLNSGKEVEVPNLTDHNGV